MSKAKPEIPTEKLQQYEKLVATSPNVKRKGASMPYTSLNGHMFSFLTSEHSLALQLSPPDREAFLKKFRTTLCEQHGRIMTEYVLVPDSLLKKTGELQRYFEMSIAYVSSLKPKATKKPLKKNAGRKMPSEKQARVKSTTKRK